MIERFESRRQRVLFVGLALVFVVIFGLAILSVGSRVGRPSPGFRVWSNLVLPALSSEHGDAAAIPFRWVLTHVEGRRVTDAAALRAIVGSVPRGTELAYRFELDGRRRELRLPTSTLRWRDVLPVLGPYLLVGAAFYLMGLVVFYFRPGLAAARAALALGVILGGELILAVDTVAVGWLERANFLVEAMIPGALLHFALCFPTEKEILRRHPALEWLVYVPFVVLGLLENVFLRYAPAVHLMLNDWVYTSIPVAGLVTVASLLHSYATSTDALARQRAKVVTAGVAAAAVLPSLVLLAVILLGWSMPINLLSPFFLIFPLCVAYAIARHDLFQVDRVLRLGVVYATLSVAVFVAYAFTVLGAEKVVGAGEQLPPALVPLYLLIVVLLFQPARARVQAVVDRLLYRPGYTYEDLVERTSHALASMLESDEIADVLLRTATESMAIDRAALVVFVDDDGPARVYGSPAALREDLLGRMVRTSCLDPLASHRRLLTRYEVPEGADRLHPAGFDFTPFDELRIALIRPLHIEERSIGILMLGEKKSGVYYTHEDIALIETLANQSAVALGNARAVESLREAQAELVQQERLAAVGQLSAAVAHGIRNPLAGIRAAAQLAREDVSEREDPALVESLDDILGETERLESRVRTVLDLARPFQPKVLPTDVRALLGRLVAAFGHRIGRGVEVCLAEIAPMPRLSVDAAHLEEALDVLLTNAAEAMEFEGRIEVRARLGGNGAGAKLQIEVDDEGPGMRPEQLEKAFGLFYTTKASGTGIGLSVARRFIESQGGTLSARNRPGRGTTFTIVIPVAPGATGLRSAAPSPSDSEYTTRSS